MKICRKCKEARDESEFGKNPSGRGGLQSVCKPCVKTISRAEYIARTPERKETIRQNGLARYARNPAPGRAMKNRWYARLSVEDKRQFNLKSDLYKHGLTHAEYEGMVVRQKNLCAICQLPQTPVTSRLHIDHCHATGRVRGLLCLSCNIVLGHAKDSPKRLRAAADYIDQFLASNPTLN